MREHRQLVDSWRQGSGRFLATLVGVQGSSYRRPGARLMLGTQGTCVGGISGGCLEADLVRKAAWLARNGAVVERYSTLIEEGSEIPFGLGCGGVLDILIEPVDSAECQALLRAMEQALSGQSFTLATWLPQAYRPLQRAIFQSSGDLVFSSPDLSSEAIASVRGACANACSLLDGIVVEPLLPPQKLFLFGAGDDVKPLASMALLLGWSVTIADGRTNLLHRRRFPDPAIQFSESVAAAIGSAQAADAAVIMTHSFQQDGQCLEGLLPRRLRYLGLLGARHRSAMLLDQAAASLGLPLAECLKRVHTPTGIDIGAEGPDAIALSILAEIHACCSGRDAGPQKLTADSVEQYLAEGKDRPPLVELCAMGVL
jgi:xanthine dehydrogenase accessory factor